MGAGERGRSLCRDFPKKVTILQLKSILLPLLCLSGSGCEATSGSGMGGVEPCLGKLFVGEKPCLREILELK